ncbi:MAG: hypothetical protein RR439_04760 [Carnobacterium sp.]
MRKWTSPHLFLGFLSKIAENGQVYDLIASTGRFSTQNGSVLGFVAVACP